MTTPLTVHRGPQNMDGSEMVKLVLCLSLPVREDLLMSNPALVKKVVGEHLVRDLQRMIDDTDFTNVVFVEDGFDDDTD